MKRTKATFSLKWFSKVMTHDLCAQILMEWNGRSNGFTFPFSCALASSHVAMEIKAILSLFYLLGIPIVFSNDRFWNSTQNFPLRIPPELKPFYPEINTDNIRPKRSGSDRQSKQLVPGVYSCGHQVKKKLILLKYLLLIGLSNQFFPRATTCLSISSIPDIPERTLQQVPVILDFSRTPQMFVKFVWILLIRYFK